MRLFAVLMLVLSVSAHAQLRTIPEEAKSGEMRHVQGMIVAIDGVERRLAPGAQIRDASNRVVLPSAVPAGTHVKYIVNEAGLVRQVWILTPVEAAKR